MITSLSVRLPGFSPLETVDLGPVLDDVDAILIIEALPSAKPQI